MILLLVVLATVATLSNFGSAEAEEVVSPLKQVQQGALVEQVSCNGDKILMSTPSGKPACVSTESAGTLKLRGFSEVVPAFGNGVADAFMSTSIPLLPDEETYTITLAGSENPDEGVISYTIAGGDITSIVPIVDAEVTPDIPGGALIISINATDDGYVTLTIPRTVADSNLAGGGDDIYFVLVDGEEVDYKESKTDYARTLTIDFVAGSEEIEIIGTFVAAEFDTMEKEEVMPPLKQVQQGALVGQVSCNGDRILMLTLSGQPACVFSPPHLLESRGFVFVEMPSRISHEELVEIFDLRVIVVPAEMPAPVGYLSSWRVAWPDYQTQQDDITMIEYDRRLYREIDLDYEFAGGKVNSYLGVDEIEMAFFFADVTTQGTFNVTIPYLLFPPVTSANIPEFLLLQAYDGALNPGNTVIVRNQTSTSQVFSFEVSPGYGDITLFFNTSIPIADGYPFFWPIINFYANGLHHAGSCDGNLIFIPKADGTHVCMQPIMLETILINFGDNAGDTKYDKIIKKYEEYTCPADAPVFLVRYDYSETTCVPHDMVPDQNTRVWKGDDTLFGNQYDLG